MSVFEPSVNSSLFSACSVLPSIRRVVQRTSANYPIELRGMLNSDKKASLSFKVVFF